MAGATPWGTEFLVNTATAFNQDGATTTALADGRFVVLWRGGLDEDLDGADLTDNIHGQVFNADGSKASGEFLANTTTATGQAEPKVTALSDGRFVVAWSDASGGTPDIRAQIFNIDGSKSGSEFPVNSVTTGSQSTPEITALADGSFVFTWVDGSAGNDVYSRIFLSDGTPLAPEFVATTTTASNQGEPTVAGLADGRFVVAWSDDGGTDGSGSAVRAQIWEADGSPSGTEFLVNTTTLSAQVAPSIIGLADGRFVAAWADSSGGTWDVRAQVFNSNGAKSGVEFLVNTTAAGNQDMPKIAELNDGRLVAVWRDDGQTGGDTSGDAIRAQVFNINGTKSGGEILVNTATANSQSVPDVTVLADGRFVVTWQDLSLSPDDSSMSAIRGQIFDPRETEIEVTGASLNDDFIGGDFDDLLSGGAGTDRLSGGGGDDALEGGAGADILIGGDANDAASYINAGAAVVVNLGGGAGLAGDALGDTLYGIEDVIGSAFDDDLTGDSGPNFLSGFGGSDILRGGIGDDHLYGDAGDDTLNGDAGDDALFGGFGIDTMAGGIDSDTYYVQDLGDLVNEGADEGTDTVSASINFTLPANVENLILLGLAPINGAGNDLDNVLTGSESANRLDGGLGADTMSGGIGNDTYVVDNIGDVVIEGWGNADTVEATISYTLGAALENLRLMGVEAIDGAGNDAANEITGNGAANVIDGGAGADTMTGGGGNDTYHVDDAGDTVVEAAGGGADRVVSSVAYTLGANVENLTLTALSTGAGTPGIAGTGNGLGNAIAGNAAGNFLFGLGGKDSLIGNAGADTLRGGIGNDALNGGVGRDTLIGGDGKDAFVFKAALAGANVDKITDFSAPQDTIRLDDAVFTRLTDHGKLTVDAFFIGGAAHDANDRIVYNPNTGALFYDSNGSLAGGVHKVATLTPHLGLTNADFFVF